MKTPLFASLPAKVAAGVAGVALLTGGTSTVLNLQPASEQTAAESDDTTTTTTSTTSTTEATTTTTSTTVADDDDTETHEHPDNFGALVSEDAHDGGVDGQEISAKARARNEARRAARAAASADDTDDTTSPADGHRQNDRPAKG